MKTFEVTSAFARSVNEIKAKIGGKLRSCASYPMMLSDFFINLSLQGNPYFSYKDVFQKNSGDIWLHIDNGKVLFFFKINQPDAVGFINAYSFNPLHNFGVPINYVQFNDYKNLKKKPNYFVFPGFFRKTTNHGFPAYWEPALQQRFGFVSVYDEKEALKRHKEKQRESYNKLFERATREYSEYKYGEARSLTKEEFEDMELSLGLGEADLWWEAELGDNPSYYSILGCSEPARLVVVD